MVLKLKRHHRKGFSIFSIQNFMRLIVSAIAFSPSFSLNFKLDPTDKTLSWESNTLGAKGFSCAVSGFGQVLKSDPREKLFFFSLVSSVFGRRRVGLRPTKLLVAREKKPLVRRVGSPRQVQSNPVNTETEGTEESVRINGVPVLGGS